MVGYDRVKMKILPLDKVSAMNEFVAGLHAFLADLSDGPTTFREHCFKLALPIDLFYFFIFPTLEVGTAHRLVH